MSTLSSRIGTSSFARASRFARSRQFDLPATQSMFDCPDENQTSPTSTPGTVIFAPSLPTTSSRSSFDASSGSSVTVQVPVSSARAVRDRPAKSTVTVAPGRARPQIGTGMPRWSTAPSTNGVPSSKSGQPSALEIMKSVSRSDSNQPRHMSWPRPSTSSISTGPPSAA